VLHLRLDANGWSCLVALALQPKHARAVVNGLEELRTHYGAADAAVILAEMHAYLIEFGVTHPVEPYWEVAIPAGRTLDELLQHAASAPMNYPPNSTRQDFEILKSWMERFYLGFV
jgi:hypothetical protein